MRHINSRHTKLPLQLLQLSPHLNPQLSIQITQRLIHQKHLTTNDHWYDHT
ncbi:hypothetical protein ADU37_CDS02860 [Thermococcus sp. 2319x1]|nr:hypothetical protein ADU37_CDS02860 [Thermococcus sp. 2319x1]